ncbi:hypothetical protein ACA910_005731 [Epithemia clementina (nom. ined.)]
MVFQQTRFDSSQHLPNFRANDNANNKPSGGATQQPVEGFPQIVNKALEQMTMEQEQREGSTSTRRTFDVNTWDRTTTGGLNNEDRVLLAQIYRNATSVFEYGLGESTLIADHVGVPRYAGVDSDAVYVSTTREKVQNTHFRFYFADVGVTGMWGAPVKPLLPKNVWNYQLAPLLSEVQPFDVYMVDGRWRQACLLASFLHASHHLRKTFTATAASPITSAASATTQQHKPTIVLMHDCERDIYHRADKLLNHYRAPGGKLCVYQRKPETTDAQLVELWMEFYRDSD